MGAAPQERTEVRGRVRTGLTRALAGALAAALGFGGAAVVDTFFLSRPAMADEAADFGPAGDGLTRYVVRLEGTRVTDEQLRAIEAVTGVEHAQRLFDGSALVATSGASAADLASVLPGAEVEVSVPGVVAADAITDPAWPYFGWNLTNTGSNAYAQAAVAGADISAPRGWQAGRGAGVVVAVLDTGHLTSHPDLQGALWTNPDEECGSTDVDGNGLAGDCHGWNFYKRNADVTNAGEDNSHGTSVAGAAAARSGNGQGSAGVAPDVTVMPLVIGSGRSVDLYAGAQAIRYAADNGADIVNASWGGTGAATILASAIEYANSKGTIVVAAAGNDKLNRDVSAFYPASLNAPNLVKVGSTTAADTISDFSAYGPTTVDLFAPGTLVYTTWNDGNYMLVSGTSIAAPQVAGALALYRAMMPTATPAELKARLLADVQPLPVLAGTSVSGGRLSLSALGDSAAPVQYSFSSMSGVPGPLSPTVAVSGPAPAGDYSARLLLGMEHNGVVMALSGQSIALDGSTAVTDDSGEVVFPLGQRSGLGSLVLRPELELQEGRYVLVAQLQRDGTALTTLRAAPLLVGQAALSPSEPVPGDDDGPAPDPDTGTNPPSPSSPSSPSPSGPQPENGNAPVGPAPGSDGPDSDSGTDDGAGPDDQAGGGDGPAPGSGPHPGNPAPVTPQPVTPGPVTPWPVPTTPVQPTPGSDEPVGSDPAADDEGAQDGNPGNDGGQDSQPGGSDTDLGGEKEYSEVGPFALTSISPTRVTAEGGTRVTITGQSIPDGARVRIGQTRAADVSVASTGRIVFTTPSMAPGTYDVYVFGADDDTYSVLADGLTVVDVPAGGPAPGGGSAPDEEPADQSGPGQEPGGDPGLPADPAEGAEPDLTPERVVTGAGGQRLVSSALFSSIPRSIWSRNCSTACSGLSL